MLEICSKIEAKYDRFVWSVTQSLQTYINYASQQILTLHTKLNVLWLFLKWEQMLSFFLAVVVLVFKFESKITFPTDLSFSFYIGQNIYCFLFLVELEINFLTTFLSAKSVTTVLEERELFIFSWGYRARKGFYIDFRFVFLKSHWCMCIFFNCCFKKFK